VHLAWLQRNNKVFRGQAATIGGALELIDEDCVQWCRARLIDPSWQRCNLLVRT
jgi:hypothetical protein